MGMKVELLIPGVQYRGKADLGLKALIVPGKLQKSAGDAGKEEIEDESPGCRRPAG